MSLPVRRALTESVRIAAILGAWSLLSALATAFDTLQIGITLAGLVMAILFVLVRGVALAREAPPAYDDPDVKGVLTENGRAMLAAGPWFVLAIVARVLQEVTYVLRGVAPDPTSPLQISITVIFDVLAATGLAFAATGVLTVALVAVATGTRALRSQRMH
jgi:hypothetical protein